MIKRFNYILFGLNISSEIKLFNFSEIYFDNDKTDVTIFVDKVPLNPDGDYILQNNYQVNQNQCLLTIPNIGRFFVKNGNIVIAEPYVSESDIVFLNYITGSVLGTIFLQRNMFVLHASSIGKDNECTMFTGKSGSGKSSIAAGMVQNGFYMLSEDKTYLFEENNKIISKPGISNVKINEFICDQLNINYLSLSETVRGKRQLQLTSNNHFKKFELKTMFILGWHKKKETIYKEIFGIEKIKLLKSNIYLKILSNILISEDVIFSTISAISNKCRIIEIYRNKEENSYKECINLINKILIEK